MIPHVYWSPRSYSTCSREYIKECLTNSQKVSRTFQLFIHATKITNFWSQQYNRGIAIATENWLFQIQMSEHNLLLCEGELHDNIFLILHIIMAINSVHASNWFTHLQRARQIIFGHIFLEHST